MRNLLPMLGLALLLTACSKKEPTIIKPIMNRNAAEQEMGCHNRPSLVKDCMEREMCGRFGEDLMNYNFCKDQCEALVKKSCRRAKP